MNRQNGYPDLGPYGADYAQDPNAGLGLDMQQQNAAVRDGARIGWIGTEDDNPDEIVTDAPTEKFRLNYLDITCLVINRMIGTGIFVSPGKAVYGTRSVGVSLLLWFFGMFYSLSGAHVYVEYGLNVPRYIIDGIEQSVPRSGGDLNYLQYVYRKPRYRRETVIYMGVLFGISFICLGNMAGNCINFAERILAAAYPDDEDNLNESLIRVIALAMATVSCFIHAFTRRGGILVNDILAIAKILILLLFVMSAIVVAAGGFKYEGEDGQVIKVQNKMGDNARPSNAFGSANTDARGYATAFLAIIFTVTGFDQPNYVLGEIDKPRRKLPISMFASVGLVSVVYMAVNISYFVVVDRSSPDLLEQNQNIARLFLNETFGKLGPNMGNRMYNAFLAISSTGNIIVMTYTASRMKQEIAKEGFLPYARFFAQSRDWSLGRILHWLRKKGKLNWLTRWLVPENHSEKTPVGALLLHLMSCVILICATWGMTATHAYDLLSGFIAYELAAFFGVFLSLGILLLRFRGPPETAVPEADNTGLMKQAKSGKLTWRQMTEDTVNPTLSVVCACIFLVGNLYPLLATWIPPADNLSKNLGLDPWYLVPLISFCVLGFGSLWWLGFIAFAKKRERKKGLVFVAQRKPEFKYDGTDDHHPPSAERRKGRMILLHETVYLSWQGTDTRMMQMEHFNNGDQVDKDGVQPPQQQAEEPQAPYSNFAHLGL